MSVAAATAQGADMRRFLARYRVSFLFFVVVVFFFPDPKTTKKKERKCCRVSAVRHRVRRFRWGRFVLLSLALLTELLPSFCRSLAVVVVAAAVVAAVAAVVAVVLVSVFEVLPSLPPSPRADHWVFSFLPSFT